MVKCEKAEHNPGTFALCHSAFSLLPMMTLRQLAAEPPTIPTRTAWYLADLGESRGKNRRGVADIKSASSGNRSERECHRSFDDDAAGRLEKLIAERG